MSACSRRLPNRQESSPDSFSSRRAKPRPRWRKSASCASTAARPKLIPASSAEATRTLNQDSTERDINCTESTQIKTPGRIPKKAKYRPKRAAIRAPNCRRRVCRHNRKLRISAQVSNATANTAVTIKSTSYCSAKREALPVDHASNTSRATALKAATVSAIRSAQRISRGALRRKLKTENRTMGFPRTSLRGLINQLEKDGPATMNPGAGENGQHTFCPGVIRKHRQYANDGRAAKPIARLIAIPRAVANHPPQYATVVSEGCKSASKCVQP